MDISCYTPEELYKQYSPSQWTRRTSPDKVIELHNNICKTASEKVSSRWKCSLDVSYGSTDRQKLDIIRGENTPQDAPIFVFIHGGYWMAGCKEEYNFISSPIIESGGAIFINMEYELTPTVSLTEIVKETRTALQFIINMAKTSQSKSIYLCGHSAGAQLCVLGLCSDNEGSILNEEDRKLIKGLILISGVYDVTPLLMTPDNDVLKMSRTEAWAQSPMNSGNIYSLMTHFSHSDVIIAMAEYDSPQYRLQSQKYNMLLGDGGMKTNLLKLSGVDHFNIIENLQNTDDPLMQAIIKLITKESS